MIDKEKIYEERGKVTREEKADTSLHGKARDDADAKLDDKVENMEKAEKDKEEDKSEPNEAEQPKEVEKDETDYKAKFAEVSEQLQQLKKATEVNSTIKDSGLENHSETISNLLRNSDDIKGDLASIKKLIGANENKVKDSLNVEEKTEVKKPNPMDDKEMGKRVGGLF